MSGIILAKRIKTVCFMFQKLTTKGMIFDLCSLVNHSKHLIDNGKDYQVLLKYLLSNNFYWDDEAEIPTIKEMMLQTGISNYQFQKMVKHLYDDLVLYKEEGFFIDIDNVEYVFGLSHRDRSYSFYTRKLPILPRVGEQVEVPYFRNYVGTTSFYVDKIYHEFIDRTQSIYIVLHSGNYNKYWHIRKDEADIKEQLPWRDFIDLEDYELKQKLIRRKW